MGSSRASWKQKLELKFCGPMELKLRLIPVGAWVEFRRFCSGVSVHLEFAGLECSVDTATLSVLVSSYGVFRGVEAAFCFGGRGVLWVFLRRLMSFGGVLLGFRGLGDLGSSSGVQGSQVSFRARWV